MARQTFTSSPGVTELREGGYTGNPTAFQSVTNAVMNTIGENRYINPNDPYLQFLGAGTDMLAKNSAFQAIYRGLVSQAGPAGSKYGNMWDYVQVLLRGTGFSTGKTATGIIDPKDISGLESALAGAIAMNSTDVVSYLQAVAASGGRGGGTAVKQPDTTAKFNRQVSTALTMLDESDAKASFYDAYFLAWGEAPGDDLVEKFMTARNAMAKAEAPTTTTEGKTTYEPVYNKNKPIYDKDKPVLGKNGKPKRDSKGNIVYQQKKDKDGNPMFEQKRDKSGVLQYRPVTTTKTKTTGLGFTAAEEQEFLADYLVANFPENRFNPTTIGGAAKAIYDELVSVHKNNYDDIPSFDQIAPTIKNMLATAKPEVAQEYLRQYKDQLRGLVAKKYMSIADDIMAGKDANTFIEPLLRSASTALETDITLNDELAKRMLNFQGSDGKYRLPNEFEMSELLMNDPRYGQTSTAKNQSVGLFESLTSQLGRR